jgi:hypothetical protein
MILFSVGCAIGAGLAFLVAMIAGHSSSALAISLAGLLTPLIAILSGYIAYQQMRTNQQKLNYDFYERRLRIYNRIRDLVRLVNRDANVHPSEMIAFWNDTAEADFLFEKDVREQIDLIYKQGLILSSVVSAHNIAALNRPKDFDYEGTSAKMAELTKWFTEQPEANRELFRKYMSTRIA